MSAVLRIGSRWAVQLSGDVTDLQDATYLFANGQQIVCDGVLPEHGAIVLQADEFDTLQDPMEVWDSAERILILLNAILYLEEPARKPLTMSCVYRRGENGNWSAATISRSTSAILRGVGGRGQAGSLGNPASPPPHSHWIQIGLNEEVAADVLSYLRGAPNWFDLYKAYEAMKKDIDALRPSKGIISAWPPRAEISAFTRDAQLHRHSKAWCDSHGIQTAGAMSFDAASALIRSMVRTWIEWRS